ncbi:ribonuclease HII [Robiginitalea aurantiaca]|uniref:Ribonuclease HII n=1 Tax=Robiginitalea aurantiaca TaxID=3056915 RepID=A0ABT7WFB2_9FLAO|nr:ribonuclease HII [Robiginitalea aurantiaca]MDM9631597.1 ribonuclease HII [Robiginitalea aurantiaca]
MLKPFYNCFLEAGTDEAGRGCLAGPVTAAAVILPEGFEHALLNDSKKVSEAHRKELAFLIRESAISYGIAHVSHTTIDRINILNASIEAMHQALDQLQPRPLAIAVDGNRFKPYGKIPHQCLVRGDGRFMNIAAASILAKTSRDDLMRALDKEFPEYHWARNKGYPTQAHRDALLKYGPTPHHRKSFRLKEEQLKINY